MGKSTINGPFSIAMLVYQRVIAKARIGIERYFMWYSGTPYTSNKLEGLCTHTDIGTHHIFVSIVYTC